MSFGCHSRHLVNGCLPRRIKLPPTRHRIELEELYSKAMNEEILVYWCRLLPELMKRVNQH